MLTCPLKYDCDKCRKSGKVCIWPVPTPGSEAKVCKACATNKVSCTVNGERKGLPVRRKRKGPEDGAETHKSPKKRRVVSKPEVEDSEESEDEVVEQLRNVIDYEGCFRAIHQCMEEHSSLLLRIAEGVEEMVGWKEGGRR